jgi:hypothetical protein
MTEKRKNRPARGGPSNRRNGKNGSGTITRRRRLVTYADNPGFAALVQHSLTATRQVWWNLRREGVDLPAERGVILLFGRRR